MSTFPFDILHARRVCVAPINDTHAYQEISAGTGRKDIKLVSVSLAGKQLSSGQYQVTDKHLVIETLPKGDFDLEVEVDVKPKENTSLEGLYNSSGTFCTQCEAEGFRGITYFYDRSAFVCMITIIILLRAPARPVEVCPDNQICVNSMCHIHFMNVHPICAMSSVVSLDGSQLSLCTVHQGASMGACAALTCSVWYAADRPRSQPLGSLLLGPCSLLVMLCRPDVMAKYVTRIEADKKACPVLLSNGNLVDEGSVDNGR